MVTGDQHYADRSGPWPASKTTRIKKAANAMAGKSRRERKQAAAQAKPPRASKAQRREDDHVDWVKSLGGEDAIRVGGTDASRHSKDDDEEI